MAGSDSRAYPAGHRFGNALFTGSVAKLFGNRFRDILSGYRVFSRRFVKSFPALAKGFEIETELSVHALELRMPIGEINTDYGVRPDGSQSKLSTFRDGFRILVVMLALYKDERPLKQQHGRHFFRARCLAGCGVGPSTGLRGHNIGHNRVRLYRVHRLLT